MHIFAPLLTFVSDLNVCAYASEGKALSHVLCLRSRLCRCLQRSYVLYSIVNTFFLLQRRKRLVVSPENGSLMRDMNGTSLYALYWKRSWPDATGDISMLCHMGACVRRKKENATRKRINAAKCVTVRLGSGEMRCNRAPVRVSAVHLQTARDTITRSHGGG